MLELPQTGWGAMSAAVPESARQLSIGTNGIAFVDDDAFEREEVSVGAARVLCVDAVEAATLADRPELMPLFVIEDWLHSRWMLRAEIQRSQPATLPPHVRVKTSAPPAATSESVR